MGAMAWRSWSRQTTRWALVVSCFALLWSGVAWGQTVQEIMVPMSDGKKLATTVVLPSGNGPWPVLLQRTPYPYQANTGLANAGIVAVIQNTRGRYKSEGTDRLFGDDRSDGADTIAWLRKQSWCSGVIHTYGGSALGITQLLMAEVVQLAGQFIVVGTPDMYHQAVFWGGALRHELVVNWSDNQAKTNNVTPPHPTLLTFLKNPLSSSPEWASRRINDWSKIKSPALHVGGWYDIFSQGTLDSFVGYKTKADPSIRDQQVLIIGPWVHGVGQRKAGELTYPANAAMFGALTRDQLNSAWLTKYVLKAPAPQLQQLAPVNVYLMGDPGMANAIGNKWLKLNDWPPPATDTVVYLRQGGALALEAPPANEAADTYSYDPKDPVPTNGGGNLTIPAGAFDQRSSETRKDVLVFTTGVLDQAVPVIGRIKAKLWVASDAKDTDFTVKLTDVYPDGRSMLVLDGIVKLRHRNTTTKEEFVPPSTPVEVTVDLWSTAIVFEKGHKIRIAISSSNAPRFQPNPNTGAPLALSYSQTVVARNTLYHDQKRPSRIIFPVVDLANLNRPGPPAEPTPEPSPEPAQELTPEPQPEPVAEPVVEVPAEPTAGDGGVEPATNDTSGQPDASGQEPQRPEGQGRDNGAQDVAAPKSGCGCQGGEHGPVGFLMLLILAVIASRRRAPSRP